MQSKSGKAFHIEIESDSDQEEVSEEKVEIKIPSKPILNKRINYDYEDLNDEVSFVTIKNKRSKKMFNKSKKDSKDKKLLNGDLKKIKTQDLEKEIKNNSCEKKSEVRTEIKKVIEPRIDMSNCCVTICFPNSILSTGQTKELQADMLGKLARKLSIYEVTRIIILKDHSYKPRSTLFDPSEFILKILQYLETPQYLRKKLFPICNELRLAGLLAPLECPHHLRAHELSRYREGVVLNRPTKANKGSFVDIGLMKDCQIDRKLETNMRVTVRLEGPLVPEETFSRGRRRMKNHQGTVVGLQEASDKLGVYWGYDVCVCDSVVEAFDCLEEGTFKVLIDDLGLNYSSQKRQEIMNLFQSSGPKLQNQRKKEIFLMFGDKGIEHLVQHEISTKLPAANILEKFDVHIGNKMERMGIKKFHLEEQIDFFLHQFMY